jgi:hypothetical protein
LKSGLRFSRKADVPSLKSFVAKQAPNNCISVSNEATEFEYCALIAFIE